MTLVFVYGKKCGTCHAIEPMVKRVCNSLNVTFIAKDIVDLDWKDIDDYNINGLPTLMLVKDDNVVDVKIGSITPQGLEEWIKSYDL